MATSNTIPGMVAANTVKSTATVSDKGRKPCVLGRGEFLSSGPIEVRILDGDVVSRLTLNPRGFKADKPVDEQSFGYGYSGKLVVTVNGKPVTLQGSINLTVINSAGVQ